MFSTRLFNYSIIIASHKSNHSFVSPCARYLIESLKKKASILAEKHVEVWFADISKKHIWHFENGRPVSLRRTIFQSIRVIVNPSFLLLSLPPMKLLVYEACYKAAVLCAKKSTRDVFGFAFNTQKLPPEKIWAVLSSLTISTDNELTLIWDNPDQFPLISPDSSQEDNSPVLADLMDPRCKRPNDAPIYLNTAIREILDEPQYLGSVGTSPKRMALFLLAQRRVSKVPWIFNTLLNEIEYREGVLRPQSFPPEIHLSLTGACNIECRFCTYTNMNALYQFVTPAKIARLDFLRYVQTLRLSAGLGEPTLNKHLIAIVKLLSERFAHLNLNFFTNGISLTHKEHIPAIVGRVRWINVSLNAASPASWQVQCQADFFEKICCNLRALKEAKRSQACLLPFVFGSMVLNKNNLKDLPRMPALCRALGVDRFTVFPYSALGYHTVNHTFGQEETLENFRTEYDAIYEETIRQAHLHQVSVEIPLPRFKRMIHFGLETRRFHDFARIERNDWQLSSLINFIEFNKPADCHCHFLWRIASIGSTHKGNRAQNESHYMYPCIGPLSTLDLSRALPFRFSVSSDFLESWNNPIFFLLRAGQRQKGLCDVCDHCRKNDTRDPSHFMILERLVAEFESKLEKRSSAHKK